jgi:hypothetical protein
MTEADFPPHIRAALDRYTVPPPPDGFAERLLARAAAGDTSTIAPILPITRPHRSIGGRWRRSGIIVGSVGLFGMVTASAAATGLFGNPVYVPVVSEALAQANIAPVAPKRVKIAKPEVVKTVTAKASALPPSPPPAMKAERIAEARDQIRAMWKDPAFRRLPKQQRRAEAKAALREAMAAGDFNKDELIQTLRDLRAERREQRAQRKSARGVAGIPQHPARTPRQQRKADARPTDPVATPESAPVTDAPAQQPRPGIQRLRERLQSATPEERAALRTEIQARRAARREAQSVAPGPENAADKPLQDPVTEAVAEPSK